MKKRIRRLLAFFLVQALICTARILPRRSGLRLFTFLGLVAFSLYRRERALAIRNVSLAFPDADPLITTAIAKGSFAALGRNALDALRLAFLDRQGVLELCSAQGEEHLRKACEAGRGVVALTGHIGCWELLAAWFSQKGYKANVIARSLHDPRLDALLVSMRRRHGIVSISRTSGAVQGYGALKRGEILGVLLDQDIDVDGVFVPFFGVPAHTPRGAAAFALRCGAAIVPTAIHMQPDGMHRITVLPRIGEPPDDLPQDERIEELTRRCSRALEQLIRMYPQQWVWFHDRWKRRPAGECAVHRKPGAHAESARIG